MMHVSNALPNVSVQRPWRRAKKLLEVFGIGATFGFSASAAYGFPELPLHSYGSKVEGVPFNEKATSAIFIEKEFKWMASVEKACTRDPAEQVVRRLTENETLRVALATQISKIYRIDRTSARTIVDTAVKVSDAYDVDPFIVLSIASVESSMNPKAQSSYGAAGLMQVYAPSHQKMLQDLGVDTTDRLVAAETLMHDLETNLIAGTRIYRDYLKQYKTVPMALQAYNGAKSDATKKYARKVLGKRDYYQQFVSAHAQVVLVNATLANPNMRTGLVADAMQESPAYSAVVAFPGIANVVPRHYSFL